MAFSQPKIELVRCPNCGDDAEVWSDEADGKCAKCGHAVCRTTTQSCIDWCKYARECLGDEEHKRYQDLKTRLRKESLLKAAARYLPDEAHRARARARAGLAEKILCQEKAADPNVVIAAVALLEAGCPAAGGMSQNEATSPVTDVLHELGYPEGFIKEVNGIVNDLLESGAGGSINAQIVQDADRLARQVSEPKDTRGVTPAGFCTATGKALAEQNLISQRTMPT
jgi:hypothetical protein